MLDRNLWLAKMPLLINRVNTQVPGINVCHNKNKYPLSNNTQGTHLGFYFELSHQVKFLLKTHRLNYVAILFVFQLVHQHLSLQPIPPKSSITAVVNKNHPHSVFTALDMR